MSTGKKCKNQDTKAKNEIRLTRSFASLKDDTYESFDGLRMTTKNQKPKYKSKKRDSITEIPGLVRGWHAH